MMYELNNRWTISSDKYNWILAETTIPATGKPYTKKSYYGTLEQISNVIINTVAKDSLLRQSTTKDENTPTIKHISLLMEKITKDLELFLKGVTNEKS
ncbi:MAG: hypothetical protein HOL87_02275 [Candidatus Thioglobus sp.]|jgi:hypothetical protein|nr:hypothetical protein [Candidatus Thioglobus sp.]